MSGGVAHHGVSSVIEDYVLAIYRIQVTGETVLGARLSEHLGVAPASVTEMVTRLRREGLLEPGRPIRLADAGMGMARSLVSRHRLAERFLVDVLQLGWDEVHDEAHRLEHALSARVTERLADFLGHPQTCPHGHPIMEDGQAEPAQDLHPLAGMSPGHGGRVRQILYEDTELLRLLRDLGIGLDTQIRLASIDPYGGPLHIEVEGRPQVIGRTAAEAVMLDGLALSG